MVKGFPSVPSNVKTMLGIRAKSADDKATFPEENFTPDNSLKIALNLSANADGKYVSVVPESTMVPGNGHGGDDGHGGDSGGGDGNDDG